MGVRYISYKIAECEICGTTKQFESKLSIPADWNDIADSQGLIRYKCVCPECSERIKDYIEELGHYIRRNRRAKDDSTRN